MVWPQQAYIWALCTHVLYKQETNRICSNSKLQKDIVAKFMKEADRVVVTLVAKNAAALWEIFKLFHMWRNYTKQNFSNCYYLGLLQQLLLLRVLIWPQSYYSPRREGKKSLSHTALCFLLLDGTEFMLGILMQYNEF